MLTRLQRIGIPCIVRQEVLPWRKCSRSVGSRTPACLAKVVMKVPTMGDSITEVSRKIKAPFTLISSCSSTTHVHSGSLLILAHKFVREQLSSGVLQWDKL